MLKLAGKYMKEHIKIIVFFAIVSIVTVIFSITMPYFNGIFIDGLSEKMEKGFMMKFVIIIAVLSVISIFVEYYHGLCLVKIKTNLSYQFYADVIRHVQKLSTLELKQLNTAYLNQRINADTGKIIGFVTDYILNFVVQLIYLLGLIVILMQMQISIFLVVAFFIPIYMGVYLISINPILNTGMQAKEEAANFYNKGNEQLELYNEIKANSLYIESEISLEKQFIKYIEKIMSFVKTKKKYRIFDLLITTIINCLVIGIGGWLVLEGELSIGKLVTLMTYYTSLFSTIKLFFSIGQEYQDAKSSYIRIQSLLDMEGECVGKQELVRFNNINIKNVSFMYEREKNKGIDNFSYRFKRNTIYIITGTNGSGKTTLMHIILGLIQNEKGEISYNGMEINNFNMVLMRKEIMSVYIQNGKIPGGNVVEVINEWTGMAEKEVWKFINENQLAELFDFQEMRNKQTSELSGGEKQKVALLITLLRNAQIFIFDEPTSNMDAKGVIIFSRYLMKIRNKAMIVLISHDKKITAEIEEYNEINL